MCVTELEKEVGGCVECEKRVERKEGQPQQDPKERGLEMEPGGPGPVTSMSQPKCSQLWPNLTETTKPRGDAPGSQELLGLPHSGSRPGPGLGPACYCLAGNTMVSKASDKRPWLPQSPGKGTLWAEQPRH